MNNLHACRGQGTLNVGRLLLGQVADSAVHAGPCQHAAEVPTLRVLDAQLPASEKRVIISAVAIRVLEGTTSVRTAGATNGIAFDQSHVRSWMRQPPSLPRTAGATTNITIR